LNDFQTLEVIDKFERLIKRHQNKVNKYVTIEDFKSELFLRIRNKLKDDHRQHYTYINIVSNQIASEQFKRSAFPFVSRRSLSVEDIIEENLNFVKHLSSNKSEYEFDFNYINLIEDLETIFSGTNLHIVKMLSKGFGKDEITKTLNLRPGEIYRIISSKIRPILKSFLAGNLPTETQETEETIAKDKRAVEEVGE